MVILTGTGLPENLVLEPPSTPEGLNDTFASDYSAKMVAIRERILGEKPQLRESIHTRPSSCRPANLSRTQNDGHSS